MGLNLQPEGTLRAWLPAAVFQTDLEESGGSSSLAGDGDALACRAMPVARRGTWLGGDAVDLATSIPAGDQYPSWVFFGGCFARVLQIAGRSTSFLGVISPRQALCTTASPRDGEKAARNGMDSRKAKLQQDLIEEQRKQDACVCLSDFLRQHLSLSNILVSLQQII